MPIKDTQKMNEHVYQEAALWIDTLADGKLDDLQKRRFMKWLDLTPQNRQIFESMLATWQDPDIEIAFKQLKAIKAKPKYQFGMLVASFCSAIVLCFAVFFYPSQQTPEAYLLTAKNQSVTYKLSDGSQLELQTSGAIKVAYSSSTRELLLQDGQAYFSVAKDKNRPFIVSTDFGEIKAVGTQFNVDTHPSFAELTVYEGIVEVKNRVNGRHTLVKAGERVRIEAELTSEISKVDLANIVDWRSGWIEISDQNLAYLIEHLNRYSKKKIILKTTQLMNQKVAGRFRLDDTDQVVDMLSQMYSLNISENNDYLILTP
ncbi:MULTISPECIES: FecR family protein [Pseudoalteromonas]|jgi:transmembrane sensor|uniref:FecR family protein n=1 Tax=Pseudoalteromonas lipolytica TaxID=570156 RepID=A0ABY1GCU2_9GAMM|nr:MULTISPECIES: FecR domain-containing protein [Pseudoalteromonas]MBE0352813.1 transmembrane sensor [Pseudoalteromonas lipolytica LMEB 39]SFT41377.1 FecR family protein [Pseudoalteromonas lipolytica]|tara:strand:+ start:876 stop:1823 length:948 start_codon:yes stop_codon:yes gene_type:complete